MKKLLIPLILAAAPLSVLAQEAATPTVTISAPSGKPVSADGKIIIPNDLVLTAELNCSGSCYAKSFDWKVEVQAPPGPGGMMGGASEPNAKLLKAVQLSSPGKKKSIASIRVLRAGDPIKVTVTAKDGTDTAYTATKTLAFSDFAQPEYQVVPMGFVALDKKKPMDPSNVLLKVKVVNVRPSPIVGFTTVAISFPEQQSAWYAYAKPESSKPKNTLLAGMAQFLEKIDSNDPDFASSQYNPYAVAGKVATASVMSNYFNVEAPIVDTRGIFVDSSGKVKASADQAPTCTLTKIADARLKSGLVRAACADDSRIKSFAWSVNGQLVPTAKTAQVGVNLKSGPATVDVTVTDDGGNESQYSTTVALP